MKFEIGIGLTTCSSVKAGKALVQRLLQKRLIACGQIEKEIESYYYWNGKKEVSQEVRVVVKFRVGNEHAIEKLFLDEHEYETPQWVYWKANSSRGYTSWVNNLERT